MTASSRACFGFALLVAAAAGAAGDRAAGDVSPDAIDLAAIDRSAGACVDFDAFANGPWRKAYPLPEGEGRWNRRQSARPIQRRRLIALLEGFAAPAASADTPPRERFERLLGDFYAACTDVAGVEAAGLAPLAPLLGRIAAVDDVGGLARVVRELHDLDLRVPFGVVSAYDFLAPERTIAHIVAGDPPLAPAQADPAPGGSESSEKRAHLVRVLQWVGLGRDAAVRLAPEVLALDARLAAPRLSADAASDPASTSNPTSFSELERLAPHIDWRAYFDHAALSRIDLNVAEPEHLRAVDRELASTPIEIWKAYLRVRLFELAAPWLSREYAAEQRRFESGTAEAPEAAPRPERCLELTESLLGEPLGRAYAERYFPPAAKSRVEEIARRVLEVLREEVAVLEWPGEAMRAEALSKLAKYDVAVGFPDAWRDLADLELGRSSLWENVIAARHRAVRSFRRSVGRPTDRDSWQLPPSSTAAYIDIQANLMVLPAGFLQPPAFDPAASDAVNYGAIGAGIAHDVLHAIDPLGAAFDAHGRAHDWWSDADRAAYAERSRCVLEQAEAYSALPGIALDGQRVLGEAVGDLVGVRVAFAALQSSMRMRPVPVRDGLTPEQQFFVAWAQFRGAAESPDWLRHLVASDSHPPARFRVTSPLEGFAPFRRAFACAPGGEVAGIAPDRCSVWVAPIP